MSDAEWRFDAVLDMETGRSVYWLMAGNRTLGKLYGRHTAQQIVAAHNRAFTPARIGTCDGCDQPSGQHLTGCRLETEAVGE